MATRNEQNANPNAPGAVKKKPSSTDLAAIVVQVAELQVQLAKLYGSLLAFQGETVYSGVSSDGTNQNNVT